MNRKELILLKVKIHNSTHMMCDHWMSWWDLCLFPTSTVWLFYHHLMQKQWVLNRMKKYSIQPNVFNKQHQFCSVMLTSELWAFHCFTKDLFPTLQTFTLPPYVPHTMSCFILEKSQLDTLKDQPKKTMNSFTVSFTSIVAMHFLSPTTSHTRNVLSYDPETIIFPSDEKQQHITLAKWMTFKMCTR